jgi:hypothetical protein
MAGTDKIKALHRSGSVQGIASLLFYASYNCYPCIRSKVLPMFPVHTVRHRAYMERVG